MAACNAARRFLGHGQRGLGALFAFLRRCRQQRRIRRTEGLPVLLQPGATLHQVFQCAQRMALVGFGQAQRLLGFAQTAACLGDLAAGGLNRILGVGQLRRRFAVARGGGRRTGTGIVEQLLPARFVLRQLAVLRSPMGSSVPNWSRRASSRDRESLRWPISDSSRLTSELATAISVCAACSVSEAE
jgi:hypothetical protein